MNTTERKLITPIDIVLMFLLLFLTAMFMFQFRGTTGKTAVISVDGTEVRRINLETAVDETFALGTHPEVTLRVANGTIRFVGSQCPAKTCQHSGELQISGDIAACVPAGVVVSIIGNNSETQLDAVVG